MQQRTVPCQGYFAPQKIEEALEILSRYAGEIKVIAGGTDLLIQYYDRLFDIFGFFQLGMSDHRSNFHLIFIDSNIF